MVQHQMLMAIMLFARYSLEIYSIRASYIGYQDVTVSNVRVVAGLTASEDFQLSSSKITTGEVVIVSKRPLIEKSSTNAMRICWFGRYYDITCQGRRSDHCSAAWCSSAEGPDIYSAAAVLMQQVTWLRVQMLKIFLTVTAALS